MKMSSRNPGIRSGKITQIRVRIARKSISARETKLVLRERLVLSGASLVLIDFFMSDRSFSQQFLFYNFAFRKTSVITLKFHKCVADVAHALDDGDNLSYGITD